MSEQYKIKFIITGRWYINGANQSVNAGDVLEVDQRTRDVFVNSGYAEDVKKQRARKRNTVQTDS